MRIQEEITIFFRQLTGWQKFAIGFMAFLFFVLMVAGWADSYSSWREVRRYEREAIAAKREAAEHIERADKLAKQAAKIAAELKTSEEKRNVAEQNLKIAAGRSADARAAYELVRGNRSSDTPTADALCESLAELGYPCE